MSAVDWGWTRDVYRDSPKKTHYRNLLGRRGYLDSREALIVAPIEIPGRTQILCLALSIWRCASVSFITHPLLGG